MSEFADSDFAINEEWLKEVGFKYHQLDRQPHKHWVLWFACLGAGDELGIEITYGAWNGKDANDEWFCWLRSDMAGRYHRFIHIRHLKTRGEIIKLVEAITGQAWNVRHHVYGQVWTPEKAEKLHAETRRFDRVLVHESYPWYESEKDEHRGKPLIEHLDHHVKCQEKP